MSRVSLAVAVMTTALLSGCISCETTFSCPAPSDAFRSIRHLDPDAAVAALRHRPLAERLDAYHDTFVRSGHPRTTLTRAFDGSGEAGFDAVMSRIQDRQSFNEYFWIIHHLGLNELDVCEPRLFEPLGEKVARYGFSSSDHPVPISFGHCAVIL